jgi:hypothetical protein
MLNRYLMSADCTFVLPADIGEYTNYNDYKLHEHLAGSKNPWAQRIAKRKPYKVLSELHNTAADTRAEKIKATLESEGIDVIWASSQARLSKYHAVSPEDRSSQIFVVDQSTEIFTRYEGARIIDRLYVAPENYASAEKILRQQPAPL